jgi:predicted transcriptional regulator
MPTNTTKRSTTYRLSEDARSLLEELARMHGVTQTAVLEMAIRDLGRRDLPDYRPANKPAPDKAGEVKPGGKRPKA